tara:strand:+ start:1514 stop:1891 length:378 start_codon:yes stop_codon:yes gene_type:complete
MELTKKWEIIVGKDLSKACKPLKIEKGILTIVANHPEWRQALIYNKHKLKDSIKKFGIKLENIKIIQDYQSNVLKKEYPNLNKDWDNHPSRIQNEELSICKICNSPTPKGEIKRWGKCSFCWRVK